MWIISDWHGRFHAACLNAFQACEKSLADELTLKSHLKTHLVAAGYKCPCDSCKYIAPKKKNLALHMEVVHGQKVGSLFIKVCLMRKQFDRTHYYCFM